MRKQLLIILCLCCTIAAKADIDFGDKRCQSDTLERYQVGPGTWYTRFNVKMHATRTVKLYMLEVDLTNPYVTLESRNGYGYVGQNELMTHAHQVLDSAMHRPIGAVNCNFYWTNASSTIGTGGLPTGGTAHDGMLLTEPDGWTMGARPIADDRWRDMGYMAMDFSKRVWMEQLLWDGKVILENGSQYSLRDCNRYGTNFTDNEICFFNEGLGTHPTRQIKQGSEIIFSVENWRINQDIVCTVVSRNTTGGTLLAHHQGCFQARGSGDTFLQQLNIGDTFRLNLGISAPHVGGLRPDIKEMAMGNALCMVDSQLICRNWNEDYNTQVYARTGIATNKDGNKLWMLVMETSGMSTEEMCYVFRAAGATHAAGCDGGGSAQMEVLGEMKNRTTEGTPRAVNTMIFAISTAPDDSAVSQLRFYDADTATIASYASYTPALRAYNQYGVLLNNDFKDYTLSVSPASLGTISADGKTFIAGATAGTGTLTATFSNSSSASSVSSVSVSQPITIEEGEVRLALDSVLIDTREYTIQAYSGDDSNPLLVDPAYFSWMVSDERICAISEAGALRGLSNGETTIQGTLGNNNVNMYVTVEIPDAPTLMQTRFLGEDTTIWTLKNGSNPINWSMTTDSIATLNFAVSSARNPQISLTGNLPLYSLPDSIELIVESPTKLKSVGLIAQAHNSTNTVSASITDELPANTLGYYKAAISDFKLDTTDIGIWPVCLTKIVLTLTDVTVKQPYELKLHGIRLYYHNYMIESKTDDLYTTKNAEKILQDGRIIIRIGSSLYDVLGRKIE